MCACEKGTRLTEPTLSLFPGMPPLMQLSPLLLRMFRSLRPWIWGATLLAMPVLQPLPGLYRRSHNCARSAWDQMA